MTTCLFRSATLIFLLSSSALLPGCTTYLTTRPDPGTADATYGAPYRLPMRQFTVEVTWQLKGCAIDPDHKDLLLISTDKHAEITSEMVEGEALVLDYQRMTNRFKTGSLEVRYWEVGEDKNKHQTRFIKTINAEIAGQEAEALKGGIKAVGSLAGAVIKVGGLGLGGAGDKAGPDLVAPRPSTPTIQCDPHLDDSVAELARYAKRLKEIAATVEQKTTRIIVLQGRVVGGKLTDADMQELAELNRAVDLLAQEKETVETASAKLVGLLTFKKKFTFADFVFSDDGSVATHEMEADAGLAALLRRAVIVNASGCDPARPACADPETYAMGKLQGSLDAQSQSLTARITLKDTAANALAPVPKPKTSEELRQASYGGFVYREPVSVHFTLEQPSATKGGEPKVIAEIDDTMPQFGRIRVLPLRSRWGEKNTLSADFAADGTPSMITYKAVEAGGPKMVDVAQVGADEIGKALGAAADYRDAKKKEADGAELQATNDQIALLTAQQNLAKLQSQPSADEASRAAELELLRYQRERAELLAAIRHANDN